MQRFLPGTARYLESPDLRVLPVGIVGTERLFPVDSAAVALSVHFGAPIEVDELRHHVGNDRREMVTALAQKVAELLPPQYRGVYA